MKKATNYSMEIFTKMNKLMGEGISRKRGHENEQVELFALPKTNGKVQKSLDLDSLLAEIFGRFDGQQQQMVNENEKEEEPWQWDWRCGARVGSGVMKFFENGYGVEFHPSFAIGSAAVRGNFRLDHKRVAYWEVEVNDVFGSSMMFGIGRENALLNTPYIFTNLLGGFCTDNLNQMESCGLSHKGMFFHLGVASQFCCQFPEGIGCRVGVLFDGPDARIGFSLNGKWLGWAQEKLDFGIGQAQIYFPMVASTAQRSRFTLLHGRQRHKYISWSLQKMCQNAIVDQLVANNQKWESCTEICQKIHQLGLPPNLADLLIQSCSSLNLFGGRKKLFEGNKVKEHPRRSKRKSQRPHRFGFATTNSSSS